MPALPATSPRVDDVRLGILYMVASVFLFSFQNAIGKWLAQSYPIPMLVFFRSAVALAPSYMLVMRAGGVRVLRTNRLGAPVCRVLRSWRTGQSATMGSTVLPEDFVESSDRGAGAGGVRPNRADDGEEIGPGFDQGPAILLGDATDSAARHDRRFAPVAQYLGIGAVLGGRLCHARKNAPNAT